MFAIIAVLLPLSGCGLYSAYSALSPYTSSSDDDEEQEDIHHSHSTPFTDDDTDDDQTFSPDGSSDSPIYHSSEEWAWLNYPGKVIPGGQIINIDQSTACSTGWIVGREQRRFILTAGHCGHVGNRFAVSDSQGNQTTIGEMVESTYIQTGGADYGLIELYNTNYVTAAMPFTQKLHDWLSLDELNDQRPRVCHLGFRTGQSCGAYLNYTQSGIIQFRGYVDHGDSGGPVYGLVDDNIYATGIISYLQPDDSTRVSAQSIEPAIQRWGLTIYAS